MADGYVIIEVNTNGEGRIKSPQDFPEVHYLDSRLEHYGFEDFGMVDSLMDSLPKGIQDVLVLCSFNIVGMEIPNRESPEFDTAIVLESFMILKTDYKEFYRLMVSEELTLRDSYPDSDDNDYYNNLVEDWTEFYGEPFKPVECKKE